MTTNVVNSRPAKKRRVPAPPQPVFPSPNENVYMNSVASEQSSATHLPDLNAQKMFHDVTDTAVHPYHISKSYLV